MEKKKIAKKSEVFIPEAFIIEEGQKKAKKDSNFGRLEQPIPYWDYEITNRNEDKKQNDVIVITL